MADSGRGGSERIVGVLRLEGCLRVLRRRPRRRLVGSFLQGGDLLADGLEKCMDKMKAGRLDSDGRRTWATKQYNKLRSRDEFGPLYKDQ
jgi:hypothetical protein